MGAVAVQAHSGAPTEPSHFAISADVSMFRSDPFPMASTKDTPHLERVKLTTAITNMLDILNPGPDVCQEVRCIVRAYTEKDVHRFMVGEYGNLRGAGLRKDPKVLGMLTRAILARKV